MCMQIYAVVGRDALLSGMELCKRLASLNCRISLIVPHNLYHHIPATFRLNPMIDIPEIPPQELGPDLVPVDTMKQPLIRYLTTQRTNEKGPVGAVLDVGLLCSMGWLIETFSQYHIPVTGFFTSSAFSSGMEFIASTDDGERTGGLFECFGWGPKVIGLSELREPPMWTGFTNKFMGALINTCDDLERPFIDDLAKKLKLRVWSVGPLFPREYFRLVGTAVQPNNENEARVINWLDSKPPRSVLFVSFGSSADLAPEEYQRLAEALEASTHSFIWVVRPESHSGEYYPTVTDSVGDRGLITSEVVPRSKILNHPCIAGFLSHCEWEAMMEAVGLGVPLLAWPKTSNQFYNAKLAVKKLKVGYYACDSFSNMVNGMVTVRGIVKGIDTLLRDNQMRRRTSDLGAQFSLKFPESSSEGLVRFTDDLALL